MKILNTSIFVYLKLCITLLHCFVKSTPTVAIPAYTNESREYNSSSEYKEDVVKTDLGAKHSLHNITNNEVREKTEDKISQELGAFDFFGDDLTKYEKFLKLTSESLPETTTIVKYEANGESTSDLNFSIQTRGDSESTFSITTIPPLDDENFNRSSGTTSEYNGVTTKDSSLLSEVVTVTTQIADKNDSVIFSKKGITEPSRIIDLLPESSRLTQEFDLSDNKTELKQTEITEVPLKISTEFQEIKAATSTTKRLQNDDFVNNISTTVGDKDFAYNYSNTSSKYIYNTIENVTTEKVTTLKNNANETTSTIRINKFIYTRQAVNTNQNLYEGNNKSRKINHTSYKQENNMENTPNYNIRKSNNKKQLNYAKHNNTKMFHLNSSNDGKLNFPVNISTINLKNIFNFNAGKINTSLLKNFTINKNNTYVFGSKKYDSLWAVSYWATIAYFIFLSI